jgi:hypothetical protein
VDKIEMMIAIHDLKSSILPMSIEFVLFSEVQIGKRYRRVQFQRGIRYTEIQRRRTAIENVHEITDLGKLVDIEQYGRSYDPDILFLFQKDEMTYRFEPAFGSADAYIEYEEDTEEDSMRRTFERTALYKDEILGNDWAFRPENVVATQGIDLSMWAEGLDKPVSFLQKTS